MMPDRVDADLEPEVLVAAEHHRSRGVRRAEGVLVLVGVDVAVDHRRRRPQLRPRLVLRLLGRRLGEFLGGLLGQLPRRRRGW